MDRRRMTRLLSALLCAVLLFTDAPASVLRASADETVLTESAVEMQIAEIEETGELPPAPEEPDEGGVEADDGAQPPAGDAEAPSTDEVSAPDGDGELEALASGWVSDMDADGVRGDYERALWLYEAVIINFERGESDDPLYAMMNLSGSPLGYARAYASLLGAAGIECAVVEGDGDAWNLAKLEGEWTHIDAFRDDGPDGFGAHFGLSDAAMARDHAWSAELPACAGARNSYFVRELGCRAFDGADELRALLAEALEAGEGALSLYNAGEALSVAEVLPGLLWELAPEAQATVSESGCRAEVSLRTSLSELERAAGGVAARAIVPSVTELVLGKGEKFHIDYTLEPEGAAPVEMTYDAQPRGPIVGDQDGNLTAKKTGKTTLILETKDKKLRVEIPVTVKKAPTKILLSGARREMGVGETMRANYALSPSSAAGRVSVSIPEEQRDIASVGEDGAVTAHRQGSFTLNLQTYNGKKAKATIEVKAAPTAVIPPSEPLTIGMGDSCTPEWALSEGAAGKLSFRSSNPKVAEVDPDSGEIRAVGVGDAEITAAAYNGVEASLSVTIVPAPTELVLEAEGGRTTIGVRETLRLISALRMGDAPFEGSYELSCKSSKPSVASVSADGVVTAKKAGKAKITATTYNGKLRAELTITVKKAPSKVSISVDRNQLGVGETLQPGYKLTSGSAGTVSFSIPEEQWGIATVDEAGQITAHSVGTFSLNAVTHNNKRAKAVTIEVLPRPESMRIVEAPEELGVNSTGRIVAALNEGSAGLIRYRVIDSQAADGSGRDVATVDADGNVLAKTAGIGTLEAYTYAEGVSATAPLRVVPAPEELLLPEKSIDLGVGDSYQILPEVVPEGCAATYSYKSSKASRASVSADGLVQGKKTGKAAITITAQNGVSVSLSVNVKKKPSKVSLDAGEQKLTLGVGETFTLHPTITKNSATTLRYESDDEEIATVAPDGTITAASEGAAIITVTTHNGKSARCEVTVVPAPEDIEFEEPQRISVGQESFTPKYALTPEGAHTSLRFELISGEGIVAIEDGIHIAALREGEAVIRAYTHVEGLYRDFPIDVVPTPEAIQLPENFAVQLNTEGAQLPVAFLPENSAADLTFALSGANKKKGFFAIDADTGWITPKKVGRCEVTVTTKNTPKKVSAKTTVWVLEDLSAPALLKFAGQSPVYLEAGDSYAPELYVFPEGVDPRMQWTSSNAEIARVQSDGSILAVSPGRVTITGTSASNPKLSAVKFKVVVLSHYRCLVMPEHRTKDPSTIASNMRQIQAVRESAYAELNEVSANDGISDSEYNKRLNAIDRAFDMFAFPWSPNSLKRYWKAANSEGGEKDFKKDTYYFGMPYTQYHRTYYPQRLINKGFVVPEGDHYRTTNSFTSREYPGSDCSSYCSMALWGYGSGRNSDTTNGIADASYYKTINTWDKMRPGDLICSGGHHVVMFLYYTNAARDQFVVIEQGGGGDDLYSNCVSTSIRDKSYYTSRKYKIRRPK